MDWGAAARIAEPPRLSAWVRRYGPAELAGTSAALAAAAIAWNTGSGGVAVAAAWAEAAAFYAVMAWRDLRGTGRAARGLGALVVEFGPAEALDSLVLRPVLLVASVSVLGLVPGVLAGKVVADVLFYGIAIRSRTLLGRWGG